MFIKQIRRGDESRSKIRSGAPRPRRLLLLLHIAIYRADGDDRWLYRLLLLLLIIKHSSRHFHSHYFNDPSRLYMFMNTTSFPVSRSFGRRSCLSRIPLPATQHLFIRSCCCTRLIPLIHCYDECYIVYLLFRAVTMPAIVPPRHRDHGGDVISPPPHRRLGYA